MTSNRQDITLSDICEIKHGFAFQGTFFSDTPTNDILLTPGNFKIGGGFKNDNYRYYAGEVLEEYVLEEGDLIISMTDLSKNSDTLGFPALVPKAEGNRFLHNQRLGKVILLNNRVDKNYLYYTFCTDEYRNEVLASATGTTVKHTSPKRILSYRFSIPQLDEQRAIAHILGTLDDKIELNRRMNETLEGIARTLFKSWFIDFDPVRAKAEGRQPFGMDTETAALFPDQFEDSELGEIPKGWTIEVIQDYFNIIGGTTPSTKVEGYWGGAIPFATPKDLSTISSPYLLSTERSITEEGLSQIGSGLIPKGTFLLSSRAPIGYMAITNLDVSINQGIIAAASKSILPASYIYFWCAFNMDYIKSVANGSTFLEVSKGSFKKLKMLIPPLKLIVMFNNVFDQLFSAVLNNDHENRTLSNLRDRLLPKLINGDLRIIRTEGFLVDKDVLVSRETREAKL